MPHIPVEKLRAQAHRLYQSGDRAGAEQLCRQLLQCPAPPADAAFLLGVIAQDANQFEKAGEFYRQATQLNPQNAIFINALGEIHLRLARRSEAGECFGRALALRPSFGPAHHNLGVLLHLQGDLPAARASFERAIELNPRDASAHNNLGAVLHAQGQLQAAAASFQQALTLMPNQAEFHFNLGNILQICGDPLAAAALFRQAIRLRPDYARAHFHLGQVLEHQRQDRPALACYQTAARLAPDDAEIQRILGDFLLVVQRDLPAAIAAFERAVSLKPDDPAPFACLARAKQLLCDWRTYSADAQRLWTDAETNRAAGVVPAIVPFQALTLPWSRQQLLSIARSHCQDLLKQQREFNFPPLPKRAPVRTGRLRIGYLSGDFYDHPISHLLHGLFGRHDRSKFEIFVYSFSPTDNSAYQRRIECESEHFINVADLSIQALAQRIHADEIHILIDLMGHTGTHRLAVFAQRPAPIQVSFLGMLGTSGADFIDYLIGDSIATPSDFAPEFTEKFVTLPHSYLIAQPDPPPPPSASVRSGNGLPEDAFVFCSFNSTYKIEPQIFDVWMKILARVPGSVLWLVSGDAIIQSNLRREAAARGVAPQRLVFASFQSRPEHLRRHQAADLFLDTFIYNGAATTAMALQAGLPVLTCLGETFASRVGASLLAAAGLPQLIAANLDQYEHLAVHVAAHPDELNEIRRNLIAQRSACPLFDTPRFARNLEQAYQAMWTLHATGRPPEAIKISES